MKKFALYCGLLALACSPAAAFGQSVDATSTIEVTAETDMVDDMADMATTAVDDMTDMTASTSAEASTTVENTVVEIETTMTEDEIEELIDDAIDADDLDEEVLIIEGEVIAVGEDVVYVQTDEGVIAVDSNSDVLVTSSTRGKGSKKKVISQGDTVVLASGESVTIEEEVTGQIVRLVNDIITVMLANGETREVRVSGSALYTNAQGERVSRDDLEAGDQVYFAVDAEGNAYQVIEGTPEEVQDLKDSEDGWPWWVWLLILAVGAGGVYALFKR